MSKLTVIQLLNKIANGEEVPKKIKYKNYVYEYEQEHLDYQKIGSNMDIYLFGHHSNFILNDEVEIIEEDKEIEEIEFEHIEEYIIVKGLNDNADRYKIDQLIRNQKKIIEAVNELKKGK